MYEAMGWAVAAIAFCSLWAVQSWVSNRRKEREAYYRAEAIKKVAEMQGSTPESVLSVLRDALAPAPEPSPWIPHGAYIKERESFYRNDMIKKVSESAGGAETVIQMMREEERRGLRRQRGGLRLAGLILVGIGISIGVLLHELVLDAPVYLAGLILVLIGLALLAYSYMMEDSGTGTIKP